MRSPASGFKFCAVRTRFACAILANAASLVTFHGYLESTFTKQAVILSPLKKFLALFRLFFTLMRTVDFETMECSRNGGSATPTSLGG